MLWFRKSNGKIITARSCNRATSTSIILLYYSRSRYVCLLARY
jgi:hypothetical protein